MIWISNLLNSGKAEVEQEFNSRMNAFGQLELAVQRDGMELLQIELQEQGNSPFGKASPKIDIAACLRMITLKGLLITYLNDVGLEREILQKTPQFCEDERRHMRIRDALQKLVNIYKTVLTEPL